MGPHENARYIMWIASNGNTTAHILPETIQEWSGNSNPCPTGPLPAPVRLGETPTPTPLQS
jgi:hypothetical protein